jgi:ribose-phosphate pyrophosphokinase
MEIPPVDSHVKLFTGRATRYLAQDIAQFFGRPLGNIRAIEFADKEIDIAFEETVRGSHVFLIQSTFAPADNLMELLLMIDAARRASAYKIIAVIPYFGYARQDRKDKSRCAIGSKLVANLLTAAGVSRIMTLDLHADQIQGFFDVPVDHLFASWLFVPFIRELKLPDLVIAAPDMGGSKRAHKYARALHVDLAISHKVRKGENIIETMTVIGDVKDKNVIIIDDIIDTAGTICLASQIMMDKGAKSVRVMATHPVLSGKAHERISDSVIEKVYVSNTIPLKVPNPKIEVLSVAELFADIIKKVYTDQSISSKFDLETNSE